MRGKLASTFGAAIGLTGLVAAAPPAHAENAVPVDTSIKQWQGGNGMPRINTPFDPKTLAQVGSDACYSAPPQNFSMFPLRGCSFVPVVMGGWRNQFCLKTGDGYFDCMEIAGHPDLNIDPGGTYEVYKSNSLAVGGYADSTGGAIVTRDGKRYLGCTKYYQWASGASAFCDYRVERSAPVRYYGGDGYEWDTFKWWGANVVQQQAKCATQVLTLWQGGNLYPVLDACQTPLK